MKIITLMDNLVYDKNLVSEHGFSLYIEMNNKNILFDTGQSGNFIKNADVLNVDISKIDHCIISHGHYDHTGGLLEFIKYNKKAKIYLKEECLSTKYKLKKEYIGIPFNKNIFENRLVFTNDIVEILKDIFIMPEIRIYYKEDLHFKNTFIKDKNKFIHDEFLDEQFLVIKNNDFLTIISGCSHNGITNIIQTTIDYFNLPVEMVLGGFHLKDEKEETIVKIAEKLNEFNIKKIGVSHCTGIDKFSILKNTLGNIIFYNYTGKNIEIK